MSLSLITMDVNAQVSKDTLISGNFMGISFSSFADRVEQSTPYHFYFDPSSVDSVHVNLNVMREPLAGVLTRILEQTQLQYAIDSRNNVYITVGVAIQTHLPADFFDTTGRYLTVKQPEKQLEKQPETIQPVQPEEKESEEGIENKVVNIGNPSAQYKRGTVNVAGYVRDVNTGEPVAGAIIHSNDPSADAVTDQYGYYSINLPSGHRTLYVRALGIFDTQRQINLYSDGRLNINVKDRVIALKVIEVNADRSRNVKTTQMGVNRMTIQAIKQIPAVFGEADILRAVLALPGVLSVGEASTGFNVRGGATDQNLVLLDGNTIYNPAHFFGFFSAFDPDIVKDVQLFKSNVPAKYGGRLSSVLEVTTREGNKKKLAGSAGIGPLTGKIHLEGPLDKDKTSFIAGFRTTYSDWLMRFLPKQYQDASANFYDGTLHLTHIINDKNSLYFTGYMSQDKFNLASDTMYSYQNRNGNIKWKHLYNNKLFSVFTAGIDHYKYSLSNGNDSLNSYLLKFGIDQYNFKADFTYDVNNKHSLEFGLNALYYKLHPGTFSPSGSKSMVRGDRVADEQALQSAIYLEDHFTISDKLAIDYGFRYSMFNYLGPKDVYTYPPGEPRDETTIQDTLHYGVNKIIKTYHGPDFRIALRYLLGGNASVKASFNSMHQYIHMLSNTAIISPTDIWKLSDPNIKPQTGYQLSLGLYKNFKENTIETSLEVYYKTMKNYLDYKSGATLIMNHHIETDLVNAKGEDYGIEFLIRKTFGKLNGWFSYTYSRALLQMDDPLAEEKINDGKYYPASYDKPNSVNLVGNYRLSHRFSVSLNVVYSTGRPVTLPVGLYDYGNSGRVLYSERNGYRIPDYFRTDFSMNIEGNAKVRQRTHNSWTLGVYNMLGRKNPYSVYFVSENGRVNGYKLSIFGSAIPFVTYNIRF